MCLCSNMLTWKILSYPFTIYRFNKIPGFHTPRNYSKLTENLTSSRSANKSEIVESCHLVLHDSCGVAKFGGEVVIVPCQYGDGHSVRDVAAQSNNFEGHRECFVAPPVCRKNTTHKVRRIGFHEFARSVLDAVICEKRFLRFESSYGSHGTNMLFHL